jgi:hypothetical protein
MPGAHIGGIDIRLERTAVVELHGRIVDLARDRSPGVAQVGLGRDRRDVDEHGAFHFDLVAPGPHDLFVYRGTNGDDLPYAAPITADGEDVTVRVPGWTTVRGVVKAADADAGWQGALGISLVSDATGRFTRSVLAAEDGTFTLDRIPPGPWRIAIETHDLETAADPKHKLHLASVRVGALNALGKPIEIAEGGNPPIEITLTAHTGRIAGTTSDKPAAADHVLIAARKPEGGELQIATANPDGSFLLPDLAAGDYQIGAWAFTADNAVILGPRKDCTDRMAGVTVKVDETAIVSLKVCNQ